MPLGFTMNGLYWRSRPVMMTWTLAAVTLLLASQASSALEPAEVAQDLIFCGHISQKEVHPCITQEMAYIVQPPWDEKRQQLAMSGVEVTVYPANHSAREWNVPSNLAAKTADALFSKSCPKEARRSNKIIQSSFSDLSGEVFSSDNGFVRAAIAAYNQHHHLRIRPEDVWFAILTQLSFHINANAEQLRKYFVAHEGKKELTVVDVGTIDTVDLGKLAVRMTDEIQKNVVDPELRTWIMPDFSTTTKTDIVTAAVLMMGSMQKYFSYMFQLTCGIPSVTLLGERSDWENIRARLDKLKDLGKEPTQFANLLIPVLDNFLRTFDNPKDPAVIEFWNKIAHEESMGSGPDYLSGWITAFCFWSVDGKMLYHPRGLTIDGTVYHKVDMDDIPGGFVSVPVTVDDNGVEYKTRMVAGSVGITITHSNATAATAPDAGGEGSGVRDTAQPLSGWWMYELTEGGEELDDGSEMEY